jgi:hypothetical protein
MLAAFWPPLETTTEYVTNAMPATFPSYTPHKKRRKTEKNEV